MTRPVRLGPPLTIAPNQTMILCTYRSRDGQRAPCYSSFAIKNEFDGADRIDSIAQYVLNFSFDPPASAVREGTHARGSSKNFRNSFGRRTNGRLGLEDCGGIALQPRIRGRGPDSLARRMRISHSAV